MSDRNPDSGSAGSGLILTATALMAIGVVMVASTSASVDRSLFAAGWIRTTFGRQLVFSALGLAAMLVTSRIAVPFLGSAWWRRWVPRLLCVLAFGLLLAALVPGLAHESRGSQRWLRFMVGGMAVGVQPSEFAKLALVAVLAWMLTRPNSDPSAFRRGLLPLAGVVGLFVVLVGKEDFGTSALIAAVGGLMLFVGGCRWRHLAAIAVVGAVGMAALIYMEPYRLERLTAYRDFWADPRGAGYQPVQSLATIASGRWFGVGLGAGMQKYGYLPECRTDFIFAAICEEMGAVGGALVILLYAASVWLGLRAMLVARSRFERLLAFGLTTTLGLQAALNIAVVTVLTPTTGIPLPLVSAGGSGTIMFCFALGVLVAISRRGNERLERAWADELDDEGPVPQFSAAGVPAW